MNKHKHIQALLQEITPPPYTISVNEITKDYGGIFLETPNYTYHNIGHFINNIIIIITYNKNTNRHHHDTINLNDPNAKEKLRNCLQTLTDTR